MWFSYGKSEELDFTTAAVSLKSHPNEIWCRYMYREVEPWKKINPFKRGIATFDEPQQFYHSWFPIKKAKYHDLMKLYELCTLEK